MHYVLLLTHKSACRPADPGVPNEHSTMELASQASDGEEAKNKQILQARKITEPKDEQSPSAEKVLFPGLMQRCIYTDSIGGRVSPSSYHLSSGISYISLSSLRLRRYDSHARCALCTGFSGRRMPSQLEPRRYRHLGFPPSHELPDDTTGNVLRFSGT